MPTYRCSPAGVPIPLPQLFTWSAASASVAFEGAATIAVTLDGRLSSLPEEHKQMRAVKKDSTFSWCFFQVGWGAGWQIRVAAALLVVYFGVNLLVRFGVHMSASRPALGVLLMTVA